MKSSINMFSYLVFITLMEICRGNDDSEKTYRLSNNQIEILYYKIYIKPNLEPNSSFSGDVSIKINVYVKTDYFTLNSKNLDIKDIKANSERLTYSVTYELNAEKEMLKIYISPAISAKNSITLHINYVGHINDDFKGLYKIQYTENASKKWVLATQLEPDYARMVFPCFDEPEYRAQVSLTISALKHQRVITLTDLKSFHEDDTGSRIINYFHWTIKIPTHTVAVIIHQFDVSRKDISGETTLHSKEHESEYSAYFLSKYQIWFEKLEKYLNVPFKDHSVEVVAIPDGDEYTSNAGLMVYKEFEVFHVQGVDVDQHKEEIAKTTLHKLTHFWFSIFSNIKWWDNTWLTESFATYLEYLISSQIQPEWKMEERFLLDVLQTALFEEENIYDTSLSSKVNFPREIQNRKFNSFIIKKGAAIIGMLRHMVNEERFRNALHRTLYEAKNGKGIIVPNDLWYQFQNQINDDKEWPKNLKIEVIMNSWLSNYGYPLIMVTTTPQGRITIKQEAHRSPRSIIDIPDQSWIIPITCTTQSSPKFTNTETTIWSHGKEITSTSIILKEKEWILCNLQQTGYYRVQYTKKNWDLLIQQLKTDLNKIHVNNRAQLIDDSFHLAIYKKLDFSTAFALGTYLENENEILPWLSIIKFATHLLQLYDQSSVIENLKIYFGELFQHSLNKVGFNKGIDEDYAIITGRPHILKAACSIGIQNCTETAAQIYKENLNDLTKVPADQRYVVYCNSFKISDFKKKAWDMLWNMYEKSSIMSERHLILKTLACTNDEIQLKRYVEMALKPDEFGLYKYEKDIIVKSIGQSFKGVSTVLDVIMEHINSQSQDIARTLIALANHVSSKIQSVEHLNKLTQIISKLNESSEKDEELVKTLQRSYDQGLKTVAYRDEKADEIKTAILTIKGYTPVSPTTQFPNPATNILTTQSSSFSTNIPTIQSSSPNINITEEYTENIFRSYSTTEITNRSSSTIYSSSIRSLHIIFVISLIVKYMFFT